MITEDYGGICPNCGYTRMCVRYGTSGWYQFDACPNCGFACGYADGNKDVDFGWDVWKEVLKANGWNPIPESMEKYKKHIDSLPQPEPLYSRTVWNYQDSKSPKITVENIMKIVERQRFMMRETVKFT
jgi:hypothetical protein